MLLMVDTSQPDYLPPIQGASWYSWDVLLVAGIFAAVVVSVGVMWARGRKSRLGFIFRAHWLSPR